MLTSPLLLFTLQWHGYISRNETTDHMIDFVGTVFDIDEGMKQRLVIR